MSAVKLNCPVEINSGKRNIPAAFGQLTQMKVRLGVIGFYRNSLMQIILDYLYFPRIVLESRFLHIGLSKFIVNERRRGLALMAQLMFPKGSPIIPHATLPGRLKK